MTQNKSFFQQLLALELAVYDKTCSLEGLWLISSIVMTPFCMAFGLERISHVLSL